MKTDYKICFVGSGSIGKRHIKNTAEYLNGKEKSFRIDLLRRSHAQPLPSDIENIISNVYYMADEIDNDYDVIFITNPTALHFSTLLELNGKTKAFFVEKPVVANLDQAANLFNIRDTVSYVACPLRHSSCFQYFKNNFDPQEVISVRAVSSSYLPDWRKGQDYRKSYSSSKEKGGGVNLDVIHEWDYITDLFGFPETLYSFIEKRSELEIDSPDIAVYIGKSKDHIYEIHLDYCSKNTTRYFSAIFPDKVVICDFIAQTVTIKPDDIVIDCKESPNRLYEREIEYFFKIIEGKEKNINSIDNAIKVLALAEGKE